MIEFKNVNFEYDKGNPVFKDLSFKIEKSDRVGLIGANGAGKSTLMKLMLGLLPFEGEILIDELSVNKANVNVIRKKIGYILQNSDNQMFMPTVLDDIMFGPLNYGHSKEEAEKIADEALELLNLTYLKNRHNHKLSGGEKKMAAIATIIAMKPKIILMDEPTSALDPYNRRKVIEIINSLPYTKLIASHDLDMILDTCDKVILLGKEGIAAMGNAKDILMQKDLLEANRLELPLRYYYKSKL
ncbi:MAG: energy-coupling factor ABC transporter ATP-binding protein [Lachnospiraceae bacterium]|nr:energy-coupling factor ABC transporter ATP-binding protein [Lachnospiraceae bacterium]